MKLIALVGSVRKNSYNLMLANTIQERFKDKFSLEITNMRDIPFYDQDEENNPPQSVVDLKRKIVEADGVLIITPEYNWSISGVLKNTLDWLSRVDKVLIGKPVMTAGVSGGIMGTIRAQLHLRDIMDAMQVELMPPAGNEILINGAMQKFNESTGRLTDEPTIQFVDTVIGRFIDFVHKKTQ